MTESWRRPVVTVARPCDYRMPLHCVLRNGEHSNLYVLVFATVEMSRGDSDTAAPPATVGGCLALAAGA